ncbi:AAA family ATPase [Archangium violaceum]|uniref:AAA family ATPase n=1 Tax=Archangium violaceum TaxID=83451 RepID=UPI0036DBC501
MYISKIHLENIRNFRSGLQTVDLDLRRPDGRFAGWTVLAGRNGTGKSTFLKAIALVIAGPESARVLQQSFRGWIHAGQDRGTAATELVFDERFDKPKADAALVAGSFWNALGWGKDDPSALEPVLAATSSLDELLLSHGDGRSHEGESDGPWANNPKGWFIAGYGPHRRLTGHALDAQRLMSGPPQIARLVSLFREDASLVGSVQWLRELHLRRLEKREGAGELLDGVLSLLNDRLLLDGVRIDKVDSDGLWVTQGGVSLPLWDMSDGYRTVTALILDLAYQLHTAYQEFKLVQQDGTWFVPYPGVVLIDEVELHLHLSWQRRIGFWFKEHFPNIQFIVTTHSPFVCQAADPKGLIRLPAPGENRTAEHVSDELYKTVVNGTVDEAALTELFGLEHVHSDRSEQLRERVAQLEARVLEGAATPEEREELKRLSAQLPDTGSALVDRAVRKLGLDK